MLLPATVGLADREAYRGRYLVVTSNAPRPTLRLREYRIRLGWTQQELAERLARLAWMRFREQVGVNADMVAKWERGAKGVSPRYRELLCLLFGVTPEQLGLAPVKTRIEPAPAASDMDQSLLSLLDNAMSVLTQLGAAGAALAPQMLDGWNDSTTGRRNLLAALNRNDLDTAEHARVATATTAELEQLSDRYQALYDSADPAALLTAVAAHIRMTGEMLRRPTEPGQRRTILRNRARVAILAGRLTSDDLGDTMTARSYYALAIDTAREAGDDPLTAIALGHTAQLAAAEGQTAAALGHLTAAQDIAGMAHRVTAWLAMIEATIHADTGNHEAAREALARAATHENRAAAPDSSPAWFDDHDDARTAAVTGHVLLRAGDYSAAGTSLTAALNTFPASATRLRVLCLLDQAAAELQTGNHDEAHRLAAQAADLLQHMRYATGVAQLRAFCASARPTLGARAIRDLERQVPEIAA